MSKLAQIFFLIPGGFAPLTPTGAPPLDPAGGCAPRPPLSAGPALAKASLRSAVSPQDEILTTPLTEAKPPLAQNPGYVTVLTV